MFEGESVGAAEEHSQAAKELVDIFVRVADRQEADLDLPADLAYSGCLQKPTRYFPLFCFVVLSSWR